jgi:pectate lyase
VSGEVGQSGEAGASEEQAGASGAAGEAGAGGAAGEAGAAGDTSTAGGSGGSTNGGSGGGGGEEIDTFNEPCPDGALDGWASVAGLAFDPSTAPPATLEVTVSNATDLATYAASPDPYIIHVSGTIVVPVLDVTSNKTLIGVDGDATIEGGIRVAGTSPALTDMVSNVVIRNLHINALTSETSTAANESDGITLTYAHHVWIDHVDIWDAPGDGIAVSHGSDYVTISWSTFRFVDGARRTGVRIGHDDMNSAEDFGHLKVTMHHIWWQDTVDQRMPRVRFGDVHVYNNLYSGTGVNSYCVAAAIQSRLLVENNYFDNVKNPHVFFSFTTVQSLTEPTAQMVANGNTYVGASTDPAGQLSGQGDAFTPPYSTVLEPADTLLKGFARHCTGPRSPVTQ